MTLQASNLMTAAQRRAILADSEKDLAQSVASYLCNKYPHPTIPKASRIIYRFDLAADIRLTIGQATRNKRLHPRRAYPDLWIAEPASGYHGLYIELKKEGKSPYKKDGVTLRKDEHIEEQAAYIADLLARGYYATFAVGFVETITVIETYLNG